MSGDRRNNLNTRDVGGRQRLNSIFGDGIVATRIDDVLVQFQYGVPVCVTETTSGTGVVGVTNAVCTLTSGASTGAARLEHYDVCLAPGETLTCSAASSGSTEVSISVRWRELF